MIDSAVVRHLSNVVQPKHNFHAHPETSAYTIVLPSPPHSSILPSSCTLLRHHMYNNPPLELGIEVAHLAIQAMPNMPSTVRHCANHASEKMIKRCFFLFRMPIDSTPSKPNRLERTIPLC
jgi:hypothetical protein